MIFPSWFIGRPLLCSSRIANWPPSSPCELAACGESRQDFWQFTNQHQQASFFKKERRSIFFVPKPSAITEVFCEGRVPSVGMHVQEFARTMPVWLMHSTAAPSTSRWKKVIQTWSNWTNVADTQKTDWLPLSREYCRRELGSLLFEIAGNVVGGAQRVADQWKMLLSH